MNRTRQTRTLRLCGLDRKESSVEGQTNRQRERERERARGLLVRALFTVCYQIVSTTICDYSVCRIQEFVKLSLISALQTCWKCTRTIKKCYSQRHLHVSNASVTTTPCTSSSLIYYTLFSYKDSYKDSYNQYQIFPKIKVYFVKKL